MSNIAESMESLMALEGAKCVAVVDSTSGMTIGQAGTGLDMDVAAAGITEVVRAKLKNIKALGLTDTIDDILITLTSQYHVVRPLTANKSIFLYVVLDKSKSNLAMARYRVAECDAQLTM